MFNKHVEIYKKEGSYEKKRKKKVQVAGLEPRLLETIALS